MRAIAKVMLAMLLCALGVQSHAAASGLQLPRESRVPGGIAYIDLPAMPKSPTVKFQGRPCVVIKHGNHWTAVVGIPLATPPGTQKIVVHSPQGSSEVPFQVKAKKYRTQYLTIQDQRKVEPNPEDLKRIEAETARSDTALSLFSVSEPAQLALSPPIEGVRSDSYGSRRVFNGQPRNPHTGMDIAAPRGTPIHAPAAGKVVEAGEFFFNGNTLYIDHGYGLVTMYCHLSEIKVKVGDHLVFALGGRLIAVTVEAMGERRGPAIEARTLYSQLPTG